MSYTTDAMTVRKAIKVLVEKDVLTDQRTTLLGMYKDTLRELNKPGGDKATLKRQYHILQKLLV